MIIFLNGCGSAGKTSIARAIQYLSKDPWLAFGVDTFISMTPYQYIEFEDTTNSTYLNFIPGKNSRGSTMRVETGKKGDQLFGLMPEFANLLATKGNNLIIDEVLFENTYLSTYLRELRQHVVYFIGVFCDLSVMQEREILRRDRAIGLANDQIDRVHAGLREYDLTIDTTSRQPFDVAKEILNFINAHPQPQGFVKMREVL